MAKKREIYRCSECGAQTIQWLGQCPGCQQWNTLTLQTQNENKNHPKGNINDPVILSEVEDAGYLPFPSGIHSLDRILGGGLHPGASILLGGEPGIGKSTLLLQMAGGVASQGRGTLYATGEESLSQIRARAERLGILNPNLSAIATSRVEDIVNAIDKIRPALLIADSVQTFASFEADGLPGNMSQVRAVGATLVEYCRNFGTTLVLVGHVTKDGVIAGPRLLEHMVDTVISLEGDRRQMFRLLRVFKNRFGSNEDLLVFHMRQNGLEVIEDPATYFLEARDPGLSGTSLVMAVDGQRPFVVEVQALVTRTYLNIPRRTALGFDVNRLNMILAVLEKRLKLNFSQADIYARVGGGIKIQEPGLDLALASAVLSSYYDLALPEKSIFWGEVDLNGQIRPVKAQEKRLAQAKRLGFNPVIYPCISGKNDDIININDLNRKIFKRNREK